MTPLKIKSFLPPVTLCLVYFPFTASGLACNKKHGIMIWRNCIMPLKIKSFRPLVTPDPR